MNSSAVVQYLNDVAANHATARDSEKAQLLEACSNLVSSLEHPEQKLLALLFDPLKSIALRLGIDMHLFDVGAEALKKNDSLTLQQLSSETKCEALLIKRVMRVLVHMKTFTEIDQDVFQPQPVVNLYKSDAPTAQVIIHFTAHLVQLAKLPDYFAEKGYECPNDAYDSPFQYAMGTKLHVFEWLASKPKQQHAFNVTMTMRNLRGRDNKWFDIYPIGRLISQKSPPDAFIVDIGGGWGHNLIDLRERYPDVPGKLIVQDIAPVIDNIQELPSGIAAMVQDFFKPQPVRHAKIYFLAHILHDWPDKQAEIILRHIRDVMAPDSVLLISESIMAERNVSYVPAVADLTMMAAFSSLERTEKQFRDLLTKAGLELVQVWHQKQTGSNDMSLEQGVVEARLKA